MKNREITKGKRTFTISFWILKRLIKSARTKKVSVSRQVEGILAKFYDVKEKDWLLEEIREKEQEIAVLKIKLKQVK